ncbi:MAG: phosphoglycerate dehydrogenase [Armatimonadota bacterium]
MSKKVVITNLNFGQDYTDYISRLKLLGYDVEWITPPTYDPDDTIAAVKGFDAVIAGGEKYDRRALEELSDTLKIIVRHGIGVDNIDLDAARDLGIAVTNGPGRNARAVAEHALAMMLCLTRGIMKYDREVRSGHWMPGITRELYGKTVGIIGFGAIGRWLAQFLSGFNCRILAYDKRFDLVSAGKLGVEFSEVDDMLPVSDFVSLHIPLTSETQDSIGIEFFSGMKPTAYFINTARGKIVREDDLVIALNEGMIAGAGLDVFADAPIGADSPFCSMENVILSPHTSAVSEESMVDMMECSITDLMGNFEGRPSENLLNPGYEKNIHRGET